MQHQDSSIARLLQLHHILQRPAHLHPCSGLSILNPMVIQVTPKSSLFDQKVHIRIQGLVGNAKVTVHLTVEEEWRRSPAIFVSCSHHVTNSGGEVDLNMSPSLGGTYEGVDPMGLFWSLRPSPMGPQNIRLTVRDVEKPCVYTISVYTGHLELRDLHNTDCSKTVTPLGTSVFQRLMKACDVRRIPIKEGHVRGTLFLPPGDGPHQGVIDMFGLAGGLMEGRGAMLASQGFAVLCLPFFAYDDLPPTLAGVDFSYFEEAVKWFASHSAVRPGGIGIAAVSGGAVFGMLMTWKFPEIVATVQINNQPFYLFGELNWKGELFRKPAILDFSKMANEGEGLTSKDAYVFTPDDVIPVWESSAQVLALVSDDDCQVSSTFADLLRDMYPENKRHLIEVVHYAGAGHLLEPPYTPHCRHCYNPIADGDLMWGGHVKQHAIAQYDSWQRILHFLRSNLPQ